MSNVILNSNQNSALVSTIRESESAVKNPVIYAEDTIGPPHSIQVLAIEPVNTLDDYAERTISFDLPKQGYLCRVCLTFNFEYTGTDAVKDHATPIGLLNVIDSIELLSSGRRIQEFDKHTILAKMSDQAHHFNKAYEEAIKMNQVTPTTAAGEIVLRALIPLDMFFSASLRTALNLDFVEPLRMRVRFGSDRRFAATINDGGNAYTNIDGEITDAQLITEYRQLAASDADAAVQANFGSGQMTQLVSTFAKAVPKVGDNVLVAGAGAESPISIDLTENAAVESLYIMLVVDDTQITPLLAAGKSENIKHLERPIKLETIKLEASGQVIMEVPAEYIQHFGKRQDGVQRYAGTGLDSDVTAFVYKLEFGFDNRFCSNVVSFRELSAPRITVVPAKSSGGAKDRMRSSQLDGAKPTLHVVYETKQLLTTSSANGRLNLSISN